MWTDLTLNNQNNDFKAKILTFKPKYWSKNKQNFDLETQNFENSWPDNKNVDIKTKILTWKAKKRSKYNQNFDHKSQNFDEFDLNDQNFDLESQNFENSWPDNKNVDIKTKILTLKPKYWPEKLKCWDYY